MLKDRTDRLRPLVADGDEITLVPFSGIQMLDFGFDLNALDLRPFKFIERTIGTDGDERAERELLALSGDMERDAKVLDATQLDD